MAGDLYSEEVMVSYLLKELPAQMEEEVDKKVFADTDYFARLLEVEEQLIEDYSRGKLPADLQSRVKSNYSKRIEWALKVETYKGLSVTPPSEPKIKPWWQQIKGILHNRKLVEIVALASIVLAVAVVTLLFVSRERRNKSTSGNQVSQMGNQSVASQPSPEPTQTQGTPDTRNGSRGSNQNLPGRSTQEKRHPGTKGGAATIENENTQAASEPATIATLLPGALRGNEDFTSVEIPTGARLVPVKIELGEKLYPAYSVIIKTRAGEEVWSQRGIKPRRVGSRTALFLEIPVEHLTQKYYRLHLSQGVTSGVGSEIDYFPFQVTKK